ncbi:unnamed protein product [Symbiodinium sp. CCMP2592]|nr:unnamed protein product [Symbiodinium sp. CCMP2592]
MESAPKVADFVTEPKDQAWIKELILGWGYDLPDDGSLAALQADVLDLGVDFYFLQLPDDTEVRQKAICKRFLKSLVDAKTMDPASPPGVVESGTFKEQAKAKAKSEAAEELVPAHEAPEESAPPEKTDFYVTLHHLAHEGQDFWAHVTIRFRDEPPAHYTIPSFCCTTVRLDTTTVAIDVRTNNAHDSLAEATHTFDMVFADEYCREDGMNFYIFSDTQMSSPTEQEKKCFQCLCLTCIYPPIGAMVLLIAGLIGLVRRAIRPREMVIHFEPGEKGGKLDGKEGSVLHFLRHGGENHPVPIDVQDEKTGAVASFSLWTGQSHTLSRASNKKVTWHSPPGQPGTQAFDAAPFANRHVYLLLKGKERSFAPAVCIRQRSAHAPEDDQFYVHLHHVAPGGKDLQAKVRVRSKNGSTVNYELVGTNHTTIRLCNVKTLEVESKHSDGTILPATTTVDVSEWALQLKRNGTNVYVFSDVKISPWTEKEKQDWWWFQENDGRKKLIFASVNGRHLEVHLGGHEEAILAAAETGVHFRSGKKFSLDMAEFIGYHTYVVVKDKDNSVTVLRGASITEEVEAGVADDTQESNKVSNKPTSNQATTPGQTNLDMGVKKNKDHLDFEVKRLELGIDQVKDAGIRIGDAGGNTGMEDTAEPVPTGDSHLPNDGLAIMSHDAAHSPSDSLLRERVVDARQLTISQDASPMVAFAAEARHNQIIGELGAEHQEQLRAMYNSGLAEVNKLRNELGNANIALSIQRSEMGQGEVRFQQTESARELAVIEANRQAEAARRALEEANSNARRLREVETSARQNDAMRSHEVADMSSRMDELMRQLQAQRQQTEVLIQQNSALSSRVRDFEARDAALRIQEGIPQGPPPGIPVHPISTPKHGGDTPTEQATDAGRRTPPDGFSPGGGGGGGGPDGNGDVGEILRLPLLALADHKNDLVLSLEEAEGYARELRINGDFRLGSCYKLLKLTPFKSTGNSRRMKATENDDSVEDEVGRDYIIIGAWIFSGMTGITTSVDRHAQLTKYLIAFMKSKGLKDTFTSICINHGGNRRVHRDLLNHDDSLNHTLGVGSYQGGSVWVEQKGDFPVFRREGVAGGKSKCVKVTGGLEVSGRVYDTHDRMLSFHPKPWHQAQPWTGDRWTITAYTIRDVDGLSWEKSKSLMSLGFQLNSSRRLPFVPSLITGDSDEELTLYDFVKKKKKDEAEKDKEHFDEAGELKSAEDQPPPPPDYTEYFPDEGVIVRHHMQPRKAKYAVSAAEADVLNIGDLRLTERQLLGSTSAEEQWDDGFRGGKASGLWTGTTYLFDRGIDKHHAVAAVKRIRDKNTAKKEARKQAFYDISQLSSGTGCMKQPVNIIEYDMKSFLEQAVQKYKDLAGPKYHTLKSASTPFADEKIARPIDDEAEAKGWLVMIFYGLFRDWQAEPASPIVVPDNLEKRIEPENNGVLIEWGHDPSFSLLGRADDSGSGSPSVVRVTHSMDLNSTQTSRDLLKVVKGYAKSNVPITVWVDLRFAGGPDDRKHFGKLWSSFVNLSTGLDLNNCHYVLIAPWEHFSWKMDRVVRWCSNHECTSFELLDGERSGNLGHWRLHTSHKNLPIEVMNYFHGCKLKNISEPQFPVRQAAVAVQVTLSEDPIGSAAVMASSLPTVSLEERRRRIEAFRRALKDPDCLAEAMAFEEPAYFKDAYGVVKEAYQYKLVEPAESDPPEAIFLGRIRNGEWIGLRKQYPYAGFPLLYEMWHRHFNSPAHQGMPIEGFELHGDSLLTEWTELVKAYLRDLAYVGHATNAERALKATEPFDVCHRAYVLSQETLGYHELMPAATALLDSVYTPALRRIEHQEQPSSYFIIGGDSSLALVTRGDGGRVLMKGTMEPSLREEMTKDIRMDGCSVVMRWGKGLGDIVWHVEQELNRTKGRKAVEDAKDALVRLSSRKGVSSVTLVAGPHNGEFYGLPEVYDLEMARHSDELKERGIRIVDPQAHILSTERYDGFHMEATHDNVKVTTRWFFHMCSAIMFERWLVKHAMELKANSRGILFHNHFHLGLGLEELDIPPTTDLLIPAEAEMVTFPPEAPPVQRFPEEEIVLNQPILSLEKLDELEGVPPTDYVNEVAKESEELTVEDVVSRNPNPEDEHLTVEAVDPGSEMEQIVRKMIESVNLVMTDKEAEEVAQETGVAPYEFVEPNVTATSVMDGEAVSTIATSDIPTEVWDSGPMAVDYGADDEVEHPRGSGGPIWLTPDQLPDVKGRMGYFRLNEMECVSLGKKLSWHLRGHAKDKGFRTVEFDEEQSAEIGDVLKVIGKQWSRLTVMTIIDLLTSDHCDKARFELQAEALDEETRLGRGTNWHFTRVRAFQGHNACLLVLDSDPLKTTVKQWALDDQWIPSYVDLPITGPYPYRATAFDLMPKLAYHATYWRNFIKIVNTGLIPGGKMTSKGNSGRPFSMFAMEPQWERTSNQGVRPGAQLEFVLVAGSDQASIQPGVSSGNTWLELMPVGGCTDIPHPCKMSVVPPPTSCRGEGCACMNPDRGPSVHG